MALFSGMRSRRANRRQRKQERKNRRRGGGSITNNIAAQQPALEQAPPQQPPMQQAAPPQAAPPQQPPMQQAPPPQPAMPQPAPPQAAQPQAPPPQPAPPAEPSQYPPGFDPQGTGADIGQDPNNPPVPEQAPPPQEAGPPPSMQDMAPDYNVPDESPYESRYGRQAHQDTHYGSNKEEHDAYVEQMGPDVMNQPLGDLENETLNNILSRATPKQKLRWNRMLDKDGDGELSDKERHWAYHSMNQEAREKGYEDLSVFQQDKFKARKEAEPPTLGALARGEEPEADVPSAIPVSPEEASLEDRGGKDYLPIPGPGGTTESIELDAEPPKMKDIIDERAPEEDIPTTDGFLRRSPLDANNPDQGPRMGVRMGDRSEKPKPKKTPTRSQARGRSKGPQPGTKRVRVGGKMTSRGRRGGTWKEVPVEPNTSKVGSSGRAGRRPPSNVGTEPKVVGGEKTSRGNRGGTVTRVPAKTGPVGSSGRAGRRKATPSASAPADKPVVTGGKMTSRGTRGGVTLATSGTGPVGSSGRAGRRGEREGGAPSAPATKPVVTGGKMTSRGTRGGTVKSVPVERDSSPRTGRAKSNVTGSQGRRAREKATAARNKANQEAQAAADKKKYDETMKVARERKRLAEEAAERRRRKTSRGAGPADNKNNISWR